MPSMPLRFSPDHIQTYSQCPRQFSFKYNSEYNFSKLDPNRESIKDLIKQCYINRTKHGYDPEWNTLKSRINKICFGHININNKIEFDLAYKKSISLLKLFHRWYYKEFKRDTRQGICNVKLSVPISSSIVDVTVDLILLDPKYKVVPIIFDDDSLLPEQLHNNIKIKSTLYLLYKEIGHYPSLFEYYSISPERIDIHHAYNKTQLDIIEKHVNFIVRGIEYKAFYTSVSEQCNSCSFQKICNL